MGLTKVGKSVWDTINNIYVNLISDLANAEQEGIIYVSGELSINDGGGGFFKWEEAEARSTADGYYVVDPTGTGTGNGCWVRQLVGSTNNTQVERQVISGTQSTVTLTGLSYIVGSNNLAVYVNGVRLSKTADYTETSSTVITFTESLLDGDEFVAVVNDSTSTAHDSASTVVYTPNGIGAVTTDVQTKLREFVSVKDFGAVGDGVTDDTAAIQAAIDVGKDITIYFPQGVYAVSSDLIMQTGQKLLADGAGGSHTNNSTGAILKATTGGTFTDSMVVMSAHTEICGFKFNGNDIAKTAIKIGPSTNGFKAYINSNRFNNFTQDVITGDTVDTAIIQYNAFDGSGVNYGMINLTSGSNIIIDGNRFVPENNCNYGVKLTSAVNSHIAMISNNLFESGNGGTDLSDMVDSIYIDADMVSIQSNQFQSPTASTINTSHVRIKTGASNTQIMGNNWQSASSTGYYVVVESGATNTVIDMCDLGWSPTTGVTDYVSDSGTATMFIGASGGKAIIATNLLNIMDKSGGTSFEFDPVNVKLYFEKLVSSNDFIGRNSGNLEINANATLIANGTTATNLRVAGETKISCNDSGAANETDVLIREGNGGGLLRISIGAADSGGAGYRVLRIPN